MKNKIYPQRLTTNKKVTLISAVLFTFYFLPFAKLDAQLTGKGYIPNIAPQSPNAAALGKYGNVELDLSTGTMNHKIPFFDFPVGQNNIEAAITYSSNGVRVDEYESSVGVGWVLNLGGVINRTVFGKPDDTSIRLPAVSNPTSNKDYVTALEGGGEGGGDTQPDIFSFSVNGLSGKFYFDDLGKPVLIDQTDVKIIRNFINGEYNSYMQFTLIDTKGVKYYFGGQNFTEKSNIKTECIKTELNGPVTIDGKDTSWLLSKIEYPDGNYIDFNYLVDSGGYYLGVNENMSITLDATQYDYSYQYISPAYATCFSHSLTNDHLLKEVTASNGNKIKLEYEIKYPGILASGQRISKISLQDNKENTVKSYQFTYSVIDTPLKYNENRYSSEKIRKYPYLQKRLYLKEIQEQGGLDTTIRTSQFDYYDPTQLPPRLSYSQDNFGYYNGALNTHLIDHSGLFVPKEAINMPPSANRTPDSDYAKFGLLKRITYPTKGYTDIYYEGNDYFASGVNKEAGGMRVKQLVNYDGENTEITDYYYKVPTYDTIKSLSNFSSGMLNTGVDFNGYTSYMAFSKVKFDPQHNDYFVSGMQTFVYNSNSITPLYSLSRPSITYSHVYKEKYNLKLNDGKNIITEYIFDQIQDQLPYTIKAHPFKGLSIIGTPLSNSFGNGKLLRESEYNSNLSSLIRQKSYNYYPDFSRQKQYKVLQPTQYMFVSGFSAPGDESTGSVDNTPDHYAFNAYYINSSFYYLESTEETQYLENGNVVTTTTYNYDSPKHLQLTSQVTDTSTEGETRTIYQYPPDLAGQPLMDDLTAQNRIGSPITTEVRKKEGNAEKQLSFIKTDYAKDASTSQLILPKYVWANKGEVTLEKKITYDKYDNKGNLLQYTLENGTPVSIIWGYNQQYPIAKIEGTGYDAMINGGGNIADIINALQSQTSVYPDNQEFHLNLMNQLRVNAVLQNTMVTTYTHKPLVGVSTITSPNGLTEYYEYDSFGRLKQIKDKDGKILKSLEYKYKE